MNLSAREYDQKVRDPRWERDLTKQLRVVSEDERLDFLLKLVLIQPIVALQIAHKTLINKQSFLSLLDHALDHANASSIQFWLDCIVPRVGVRSAFAHLICRNETKRAGVAYARYFMPKFADLPGYSREDLKVLDEHLTRVVQPHPTTPAQIK